jgi:hypothetical protein
VSSLEGADRLERRMKALRDGTATDAMLNHLGQAVVREARINLQPHRKTGTLARSVRVADVDSRAQTVEVRAGGVGSNGYAIFLEKGTGIYGPTRRPIVPVRAKVLRFPASGAKTRLSGNLTTAQRKAGGGFQFRRSVRGIPPVKYMERAVQTAARMNGLSTIVVDVWNKSA